VTLEYDPPIRSADISPDGVYRYTLGRTWDPRKRGAVWIMLNPSTADASIDDPTIRRCIGFSRAWGCGWLRVVNLFALRSADPAALLTHADPIGPHNDRHLITAASDGTAAHIICAWGAHKAAIERARAVEKLLEGAWSAPPLALAFTKGLAPAHPLYQPADAFPLRMVWR
jgi:hypothetical protein